MGIIFIGTVVRGFIFVAIIHLFLSSWFLCLSAESKELDLDRVEVALKVNIAKVETRWRYHKNRKTKNIKQKFFCVFLKTTKFVHRKKWSKKQDNFFFQTFEKIDFEKKMLNMKCTGVSLFARFPDLFHQGCGLVVGHLDSGDVWSGLQVDSVELQVLVVQLSVHVVRHVAQVTDHRAHLKKV